VVDFDPRYHHNASIQELVITLFLDIFLQEDHVDPQQTAVRDDLRHLAGAVVHDLLEGHTVLLTHKVSRFESAIEEDACHVGVKVFQFFALVILFD
jgi:hypothetical protein